jgi:aminopeptidase N
MSQKNYQYLDDYQPPVWQVETVALRFDLAPVATRVTSRLSLMCSGDLAPIVLDGEDLELCAIRLDDKELSPEHYHYDGCVLTINAPAHKQCTLETEVIIAPKNNTRLEGLYQSSGIYCTQCEAEGFRRITFFPDRPDVLARYTVTIISDCPVNLSNGNLVKQHTRADGRQETTWQDPFPKPSYLFALVAGDLQGVSGQFTTRSGREVTLWVYAEAHNAHLCDFALTSLKQAMEWDERVYGLEYDLDCYHIVAVDDFNMGAMENKSLNVFNSKYVLASPETATDDDYLHIQSVIGHEYFHNYSGNRVTCRDWFQLSLKEGLTVFRDQQFTADFHSEPVKRIQDVSFLRKYQFPEDDSALAHPVRPEKYIEINNFYTVTVYEKGAEIIRMLATMLGKTRWRAAMDMYFSRFDGQAVTIEDLLSCVKAVSGEDYVDMLPWYQQAGTPKLIASWQADGDGMALTIKQTTPPLPIPVKLAWVTATNVSDTHTHIVTETESRYHFPGVSPDAIPSLLQGFSAPVRLIADYTPKQRAHLIQYDTDPFNRWDAWHTLMVEAMLGDDTKAAMLPDVYGALVEEAARNPSQDPAYFAELLRVPDMATLIAHARRVDIDALSLRYRELRSAMVLTHSDLLTRLYQTLQHQETGSFDPDKIGLRTLKNAALAALAAGHAPGVGALATQQYHTAATMTDRMSALGALLHSETSGVDHLLADFYEQWHGSALVLDKWFAVQAQVESTTTFARVQQLASHPDFNHQNPNRSRALLSVFSANPIGLHHGNAPAYAFIADWVIKIDAINPQVAARLCKAFAVYPKLDTTRQQAIRAELIRLDQQVVSPDLYEVVQNLLNIHA